MSDATVRVGVLGSGKVARTRFLPAARQIPGVEVTAIGTRTPAQLDRAGLGLSADCAVGSYADVLAPSHVDAIYVALPNDLHVAWVLRAAQAGLHVLCEKPLAPRADDALRCRAACADAGVVLAEAFMYRHDPRHARVRDLLAEGQIGAVRLIEATFGYRLDDPGNIRLSAPRLGGALMDVGCYGIDLVRLLTGQQPELLSVSSTRGQRSKVDELVVVILGLDGGAMAIVSASTHIARTHGYSVRGTLGTVHVPDGFVPKADATRRIIVERDGERRVEAFEPADAFVAEIAAFASAVRARRLAWPVEDGVENARLIEAIRAEMGSSRSADFIGGPS